ncbi:MAG: hypothetical protein JSR30_00320 [Proteobacteria bacterium]|nr:hypothetical protein [Pseudomonadota bacterium]
MISTFDQSARPSGLLTVSDAVTRYLGWRVDEGMDPNSDTYRHIRLHLVERFCRVFGTWPLADVTTQHLRDWAKVLTETETGRKLGEITRRHHMITVKIFFKRCWAERLVTIDPAKPIVLPEPAEKDVSVISPQEAFEFFKVNRDAPCVGRIALEAFGGLRFSSAGRLVVEDLKFQRKGIEMAGNKHKSGRRKYRQGQPSNLWEWLTFVPELCWTATKRQYADEKKDMFVAAGLKPRRGNTPEERQRLDRMRNIWRYSFASYLLAMVKNYGAVAYLMQHSQEKTTQRYEGRCDEFDAALYFSITPSSVLLPWDQFHASVKARFDATVASPEGNPQIIKFPPPGATSLDEPTSGNQTVG